MKRKSPPSDDDKFVARVQDPAQRDSYLNQWIKARSIFRTLAGLTPITVWILVVLLGPEMGLSVTGFILLFLFMCTFAADARIKMIKLFSTQQEPNDNNPPKTD